MSTLSEATRIAKLERTVGQQSYVIYVLMVLHAVGAAALLLLWNGQTARPNFDHIAVALSAFQVMFAVAAIFGFWALRGLTKEKAVEVAEEEVRKVVPSLVNRQVEGALSVLTRGVTLTEEEVAGIVKSVGEDESNGK